MLFRSADGGRIPLPPRRLAGRDASALFHPPRPHALSGRKLLTSLQKWQLTDYLDLKGYISHTEAIALQRQSQLLLLLEINHPKTEGIIPGKLFEYMASQRPILALGYKQWDVKDIIAQTQTGITLSLTDTQAIREALTHYYTLYKSQQLHTHPTSLETYHRKNLTKRLSEVILRGERLRDRKSVV